MNCFQHQNHSSDFLDRSLPESLQQEAQEHLDQCKKCQQRHTHFQIILSSIQAQPKATLPHHLAKAPLLGFVSRFDSAQLGSKSKVRWAVRWKMRWDHIPWILRTLIEASATLLFILISISSAPKLRALYEKRLDWSLNDFKEDPVLTESALDEGTSDPESLALAQAPQGRSESNADDLEGEDESESENPTKVGKSELWRFTLKTVSPDELRPLVIQALKEIGVTDNTPGLAGLQVPGGIEFDLVLPLSIIPQIKRALPKLSPAFSKLSSPTAGATPVALTTQDHFSWYRVKSKRKLADGKSQVVIWLSQAN